MAGYDDWTQEERDAFDVIAAEGGLTGRELWERIKPTADDERFNHEYNQAHPEYRKAVKHFAARCKVTPERFERERHARIEIFRPAIPCLTLTELVSWPNFPDSRQKHVDSCKFCQELLQAMNVPINPEHEREFVKTALETVRVQKK